MPRKLVLLALLSLVFGLAGIPILSAQSSQPSAEITVAAASNLTNAFMAIADQFQSATGIKVTLSFGSTGSLSQQIRNGAPFDLFAAADVATVDSLVQGDFILPESEKLYARGKLIIWWTADSTVQVTKLDDLLDPKIGRIAIANPDVAPYGAAAKDTLIAAGLWDVLQPKIVIADNVTATKQVVATGNAEVAFIPISLVTPGRDGFFAISGQLHKPLDQALGILKTSTHQDAAQQFITFLTTGVGRVILEDYWYSAPCADPSL
ncbi:molybdate ABC transporter substrate-binding protein [Candidatus Acetothermia bacterium]|nr:molybdate ABC transporter substrate-binding protein [Candidatus Acetothermia bacterium]MBI3643292.1 molybdate ABC transporter substrate-binding protein [Candidatus Acetothermia bacterium]